MQETANEIRTMGREELIDGIIKKHERMLQEFYKEYKEIGATVDTLDKEMQHLKQKMLQDISDKEIYDEKKYMFAAKVIGELEAIQNSIKDIKQPDVEFTKKDIGNIIENINFLKSPKNAENRDEKKRHYDEIISGINGLYIDKGKKDQMLADMEIMYSSYIDLRDVVETEEEKKKLLEDTSKKMGGKKRYEWLTKRIESHLEAQKYWQNEKESKGA